MFLSSIDTVFGCFLFFECSMDIYGLGFAFYRSCIFLLVIYIVLLCFVRVACVAYLFQYSAVSRSDIAWVHVLDLLFVCLNLFVSRFWPLDFLFFPYCVG